MKTFNIDHFTCISGVCSAVGQLHVQTLCVCLSVYVRTQDDNFWNEMTYDLDIFMLMVYLDLGQVRRSGPVEAKMLRLRRDLQ